MKLIFQRSAAIFSNYSKRTVTQRAVCVIPAPDPEAKQLTLK